MSNKKQIKITKKDLIAIYGKDFPSFEEKIISNCWCGKCRTHYKSTIINYEIFLNDLDDTILKGFCAKCGNRVNRYLETGDVSKPFPPPRWNSDVRGTRYRLPGVEEIGKK